MTNHPSSTKFSSLDKSRANLVSLLWQATGVFLIFVVMLVLTAGKPSGWTLSITFLIAGGFVVWAEAKREQRFNQRKPTAPQLSVPINYLRNGKIEKWNQWRTYKTAQKVNLMGANLPRANLAAADLSGANLSEVNLMGANLTRANLTAAFLAGANLTAADLTRADLTRADLTAAALGVAALRVAFLAGANLMGADLTRANLRAANLMGVNLMGADLTEANLMGANLMGADLTRANLMGANLLEANLTRALLYGTVVKDAVFGFNPGLTDEDRAELEERGAIFQDLPGDTSNILVKK